MLKGLKSCGFNIRTFSEPYATVHRHSLLGLDIISKSGMVNVYIGDHHLETSVCVCLFVCWCVCLFLIA